MRNAFHRHTSIKEKGGISEIKGVGKKCAGQSFGAPCTVTSAGVSSVTTFTVIPLFAQKQTVCTNPITYTHGHSCLARFDDNYPPAQTCDVNQRALYVDKRTAHSQ